MEVSSDAGQILSAFISQLLSGVVESVRQQGYQVSFLASKSGDDSNDILSLHGGLSLNIQKKLEVNFKSLIEEASQEDDCSISQSGEEKKYSNHTVSIPLRDVFADTIKVECTSEFNASQPEYLLTNEPTPTADDDADEPVEYNSGKKIDGSQIQEMQIKPEPPCDLQIEYDDTQTRPYGDPEPERLRVMKKCKSKLIPHIRTHTGDKLYACIECPYRCKSISRLKIHILTHTREQPFACPGQSTSKKHILTHTGEKPFACPECPYRSIYKSSLRRHLLIHSGEKPFACPECPHRSRHLSSMKKHMLSHTGEKPIAVPAIAIPN